MTRQFTEVECAPIVLYIGLARLECENFFGGMSCVCKSMEHIVDKTVG